MPERRFHVLAVATHPVQYQVPLFRRMAAREDLELQVAYCTLRGAEAAHDPEFGATVQWDVPLLDGYSWIQVPNRGSGAESFLGLRNSGLWKLIREGKFDAVLCYASYRRATFWIAYFAAKFSGAAFLFGTDTTTLTPLDGRMWKRRVKRFAWPLLFRLADQVIVPSSGSRELMRSLGLPEERVTLTPYVVDNDWWLAQSARVDRAAVRASWGASPEDAVVLFCAKLQPWKRPLDLLQAFAKANIPKALLVFAGDRPAALSARERGGGSRNRGASALPWLREPDATPGYLHGRRSYGSSFGVRRFRRGGKRGDALRLPGDRQRPRGRGARPDRRGTHRLRLSMRRNRRARGSVATSYRQPGTVV